MIKIVSLSKSKVDELKKIDKEILDKGETRPHLLTLKLTYNNKKYDFIIPIRSNIQGKISDKLYYALPNRKETKPNHHHGAHFEKMIPIERKDIIKCLIYEDSRLKEVDSYIQKNSKEIILKAQNYLKEYQNGKRSNVSTNIDKHINNIEKNRIKEIINSKIENLNKLDDNLKIITKYELKIEGLESLIVKKELLIKEDKKNTVLYEEKKELIFKRDTINEELKKYDKDNLMLKKDNIEKEIKELKTEIKDIEKEHEKKIEDKKLEKIER